MTRRSFFLLWLSVFLTVSVFFFALVIFFVRGNTRLDIDRLHKAQGQGLVMIGTSLVLYGFPYDQDFQKLAAKKGLCFSWVRFGIPSGDSSTFQPLLAPILKVKPKMVFIQLWPFILSVPPHQFGFAHFVEWQESARASLYFLLNVYLLRRSPEALYSQSDESIKAFLKQSATQVAYADPIIFSRDPKLPAAYEDFLVRAHKEGVRVVFLNLHRSREAHQIFGRQAWLDEMAATKAFQARYHVEIWQSPMFSLRDTTDGQHLNQTGRAKLTNWFLGQLRKHATSSSLAC